MRKYLGHLDDAYISYAAFGKLNGVPVRTDWVTKINSTGSEVDTKEGYYTFSDRFLDENKANALYGTLEFNKNFYSKEQKEKRGVFS